MKLKLRLYEESNINANFKSWFGNSKVVDGEGRPLKVYHGTGRPDRVGSSFNPKRAMSGPMQYFTSDPQIASGYATTKRDTSLEDEESYATRFMVKPKGSRSFVDIVRYWYYLPYEKKQELQKVIPYINRDTDSGGDPIYIDEERGLNTLDNYIYEARKEKGNYLAALANIWLTSGELFNEEEKFLEVLALLNLPDPVKYVDPYASYPAIYPVYLSMNNPLFTNVVSDGVKTALVKASKGKRSRLSKFTGVDAWDKNAQEPKEWISNLLIDEPYIWTSIPDWVTTELKALDYDGIIDTGNKSQSTGIEHNVYIPFYPWQIKSVHNKGTWSASSNKIDEDS